MKAPKSEAKSSGLSPVGCSIGHKYNPRPSMLAGGTWTIVKKSKNMLHKWCLSF